MCSRRSTTPIGDGFIVNDDYSVTDGRDCYSDEEFEQRHAAARRHASFIGHRVTCLVVYDREIATTRNAATNRLDKVAFDESHGTVHQAGWDRPLRPDPGTPTDTSAFKDLSRATDQAALEAMARSARWATQRDAGNHGLPSITCTAACRICVRRCAAATVLHSRSPWRARDG